MIENLQNEEWRNIEGYEGMYQVSNMGRVKSLERYVVKDNKGNLALKQSRLIIPHKQNSGYLYVSLNKKNTRKNYLVHRLVALAFIDNPNNYLEVNHKDENKLNNISDNLEWCTHQYNNFYGTKIERQRQKMQGRKRSPESIEKTRLANLGKKRSKDFCELMSKINKGRVVSEETRKKLSEANRGKESNWKGRHHTEETKQKLRDIAKGKLVGEKNGMYGKTHTLDALKKMWRQVAQLTMDGELIKVWDGISLAARELKICNGNITSCCKHKVKSAGGFKWEYIG